MCDLIFENDRNFGILFRFEIKLLRESNESGDKNVYIKNK